MQQPQPQHKLPPRAPSPQGFGGGPAFSPMQGAAIGALSSSSQAAAAAAQMAYEDAWKASNPDFRTPFASVEDAITRCVDLDPLPLPLVTADPASQFMCQARVAACRVLGFSRRR